MTRTPAPAVPETHQPRFLMWKALHALSCLPLGASPSLSARERLVQLRAGGQLRTYAEFGGLTAPPRTVCDTFGQMLLSVHGMATDKVARLLERYPTPREVAEALEAHRRECAARGEPKEAGWLFAELLEPGKRRRALSEKLTEFFDSREYADAPAAAAPALDGLGSQGARAWPHPD